MVKTAPSTPAPPRPAVPHPIPEGYAWLNLMSIQVMPRTIRLALQELGVKEVAGPANSPIVMGYAHELGLEASYPADKIPWCGAFVGAIVKRAGKLPVHDPLWALNWKKFGVEAGQPSLGDCTVFQREGGGHVAWYVAEDPTHYHVCGGNQSNAVSITRIEKERCVAVRRPIYNTQPASVKPYLVAASGAVSTNEA